MKSAVRILIIIILILSAGCRGGKTSEKDVSSSGSTAEQENVKISGSGEPAAADNYGGKGDRIKKVVTVNSEKKTVKTVKNYINTDENMVKSYFLLSEMSGKENIDPEDFEIGSLYGGDKQFREAADLLYDFFGELKNNNVKTELIAEDSRFYLGKIFEEYIKSGSIPENIRIGAPLAEGDKIYVSLKFLKNGGKSEGEIVIIKKSGSLFIEEFEGDLSLLDSEAEEGESDKKFEPEIYRFN